MRLRLLHSVCFVFLILAGGFAAATENASSSRPRRRLNLPRQPFRYRDVELPAHVRAIAARFDNTPKENPISDHGATLGRVLFYDKTLSANGTVSCASCHRQPLAFTDGSRFSVGFDGRKVRRNSMSLVNVRYYRRGQMFWDERAESLEAQVLMPIENEVEMGHRLPALIEQLQKDPLYPPLFENAFGSETVTQSRVARALAQFVRSIASFHSKFDEGRAQVGNVLDAFPNFTAEENYGKLQFFGRAKCASCHLEDEQVARQRPEFDEVEVKTQDAFFYVMRPVVNGVDSEDTDIDEGVAEQTGRAADVGRFKVPSLRNIELTGPYMHDGRFHTLDQVIEHYNWSVKPHPNLDPRLADFAAHGLALPEREKVALTKFLLTLTDRRLLSDPKFADPFVNE